MSDPFVANAVFLLGEGERDERGGTKVGGGAREGIQSSRADPKLNIAEAEHVGVAPRGSA